jgi:DNA recombination protein RmuC
MEPIVEFSGASITLTEILLAALLVLIAIILTALIMRRGKSAETRELKRHLGEMRSEQSNLQGRLSQFAEDSERRDANFADVLDTRLAGVSDRVGRSLELAQTRTGENLSKLNERLSLIDQAQSNIKALAGEVSSLQSVLSNKQARGAFGEKQMQDLIRAFLPTRAFTFQHTLSNNTRVDALIHMPEGHGDVAVDSKFPLESWRRMIEAEGSFETKAAKSDFRADVLRHIRDIARKYLIEGETYELALLFLPSDAIFSEVHSHFDDVIDKGFSQRVVVVSPTTFMATLHTMQAVMNDAEIQKNAALIKREVSVMSEDVARLGERVARLQKHFRQADQDISDIQISTRKITTRAKKIGKVEFEPETENAVESKIETDLPTLKLLSGGES